MRGPQFEFSPSTHVIAGVPESLVVDLQTRRWVRMRTTTLDLIRGVLAGGSPEASTDATAQQRLERTLEFLQRHEFVTARPADPSVREPAPSSPVRDVAEPGTRTLQFHITHRCNLRCSSCYVADRLRTGPDRLTAAQIDRTMRVAASAGFTFLNVTGGEPLLREDVFEILRAARPRFRHVSLSTNGTTLSPRSCGEVAATVDAVQVSLDGATPEVNDRIRGRGAFSSAMRGLSNLAGAGFPMQHVTISPTVTRQNHEHLEDLLDLAATFGAQVNFGFFVPTGRGLCNREQLTAGWRDMLGLFDRTVAKRRCQLAWAGESPERPAMNRVRTTCGIHGITAIQADGSLFPCPNLNQSEHCLGNCLELDDTELADRLSSPEAKRRYLARAVEAMPECSRCECRHFCAGGCMANAYLAHGHLLAQDPHCGFYLAVWKKYGPLHMNHEHEGDGLGAGTSAPQTSR